MFTTCNCFKHESNDIYYTAFTVILIKNMNKQKKSYNDHSTSCVPVFYVTLQFQLQSQMSRPSCCKFTTAIWCVMRKRASPCSDYSSAQWAVTTLVRYADALAAVGVNCSSSSSELSACWLARCSTNRRLWLKQRACCFTYVLSLGINAVDHTIPSNNTRITLNAYVCSCSTPSFSSPANSAIPFQLHRPTLL